MTRSIRWRWLGAALVFAVCVAAHLHVRAAGSMSYAGAWLVVEHAYTVVLVLALLSLCAGVGRLVLSRFGLTASDPLTLLLLAVAVGSGVLAAAILAAGFTAGVSAIVLGGVLLAAATVSRNELLELGRLCVETWRSLRLRSPWALAFLATVTCVLVLLSLAPPADWDSLMYHLEVPARFLERGRIHLPEDNLHTSRVGLVHMLYLPLLAFGGPAAPAVLSAVFAALLALNVYAIGVRHLGERSGRWASAWLWGSSVLVPVGVTARVDVTLAFYLLAAHAALLDASSDRSLRTFYLAGGLLGLGVGVKSPALAYALALSPLVLRVVAVLTPTVRSAIGATAAFTGIALAAALPWWLKNALLLGHPLFPILAPPRMEPWLQRLYGSPDLPASAEALYGPLRQVVGDGGLLDLFFRPSALALEGEATAYALSPLFLLVPGWILFRRNRIVGWLLLPALAYTLIALIYLPALNPRYLIPALPPLTLAVTHMVLTALHSAASVRLARTALVVLTVWLLLPSADAVWKRVEGTELGPHLAGAVSRREYLRSHPSIEVRSHAASVQAVELHAPPHSRILFLLEARGFYFEPEVIQDNRIMNWAFVAPKALDDDCLAETGITHVIVSRGALAYYESRGLNRKTLRWRDFERFAESCLTPVHSRSGFTLYEASARAR